MRPRPLLFALGVVGPLLAVSSNSSGQVQTWQFGGTTGQEWSSYTGLNVFVDDVTDSSTLRPRELDPEVNLLPQLSNWHVTRFPSDPLDRDGQPRIWRGLGSGTGAKGVSVDPDRMVDGDPNTAVVKTDWNKTDSEFYTIDVGAPIPFERFVYYPPEGFNTVTDEPFRPNYTINQFELTASNDVQRLETEEPSRGPIPGGSSLYNEHCNNIQFHTVNNPEYEHPFCEYVPLDTVLHSTAQNFAGVVDLSFPLQYLRFFRFVPLPDEYGVYSLCFPERCWHYDVIYRLAYAEFEIYGRGFVPQATWESQIIDLAREVNFGRLIFGLSPLRRADDGEGAIADAPDAPIRAEVELRTGHDDSPKVYTTYNTRGDTEETSLEEYLELRESESSPLKTEGWRGPIIHDTDNWSFWSTPVRESGVNPRLPSGRYLQVRVRLYTDGLWTFARMDSLALEFSPLLAERVVGEVATADDLSPYGRLARVEAGIPTEFVYDIAADFGDSSPGFDTVRLLADGAEFINLQMGEPPTEVVPQEVVAEPTGFSVLLPRTVSADEPPLRIRFNSTLYGAAGTFGGEVFRRESDDLPQAIEAGDASAEVGTNRLQVVAMPTSLGSVLGPVTIEPALFSPQGDGVNDRTRIAYDLLRVADAEVEVSVHSLDGRLLWRRTAEQSAGAQRIWWDGRDDRGALVPPGLYLVRVKTISGGERLQRLAIAY